jgi:phosphoribosylanthranilate isomerase
MSVKIKISGLRSEQEVDLVNEVRPDFASIMLCQRFWRRVDFDQARALRRRLNSNIPLVGVFVNDKFSDVLVALRQGVVDMVQLQGTESEEYITSLQMMSYGKPVIKACEVHSPEVIPYAENSAADHILLHCPPIEGQPQNWDVAKNISRDFILAGSLSPDNLNQALSSVRPWGVDLCGGVEVSTGPDRTDRVKDHRLLLEAADVIRSFN